MLESVHYKPHTLNNVNHTKFSRDRYFYLILELCKRYVYFFMVTDAYLIPRMAIFRFVYRGYSKFGQCPRVAVYLYPCNVITYLQSPILFHFFDTSDRTAANL